MKSVLLLGSCSAALCLSLAGVAMAADATAEPQQVAAADTATRTGGEEELTVTAQRRSEVVQRVPASISAVGAAEIKEARIESALDLPKISPSVNVSTYFGAVQINIRGLGLTSPNPAGEPSVLTYVDGVFLARPTAIGAAFDDLSRIEVLRGPQGTLYGRNATGGVVNLITREPGDEFAANVSATYGAFNRFKLTGGVDIPIDTATGTAARISVYHETKDGDQFNAFDNNERIRDFKGNGIRGTVRTEAIPDVTLTLRGDYYEDDVNGINFEEVIGSENAGANGFGSTPSNPSGVFPIVTVAPRGPLYNDGKHLSFNEDNPRMRHKNNGVSLTADWDITESMQFKSITAYRYSGLFRDRSDYDGTSAAIMNEFYGHERSEAFSQEFDLSGETSGGITYVVGGYFFHEELDLTYLYYLYAQPLILDALFGLPPGTTPNTLDFNIASKTQSASVFAQATVPLTDQLKLTGGIRQNWDEKEQVQSILIFGGDICGGPAQARGKWNDLTWKVGLDYQINENSMLYASVSKGFKAGGLNLSACNSGYDPEQVIAYEAGTKNKLLDGKLILNLSGFIYDYNDLQVNVYRTTSTTTENSASANVYGAEVELRVLPTENLEISGSLSWLHAEYEGYLSLNPLLVGTSAPPVDLTGFRLANAPKFLGDASIQYTIPVTNGEVKLRYDLHYNSGWYGDAFHNPGSHQKAVTTHSARIAYRFDNYEIGVFGDNLTNEIYADNRFSFSSTSNVIAMWAPRRTWGVFVNADF